MFVGRHVRQLDGKGRLAIPAEYLELLAEGDRDALYVTPGKRGGLWLVPPSYYLGDFVKIATTFEGAVPDEFFHVCQRRPLDRTGRILIDQEARGLAGLPETGSVAVVVCGSGRYLQVWPKADYDGRSTPSRQFAANLPGSGNAFGGGTA